MPMKYVIFGILSGLMITAVYSMSAFTAFAAEGDTACTKLDGGQSCTVDNGDGSTTGVFCWKVGKVWKCEVVRPGGTPPGPDLKSALNGAISHSLPTNANPTTSQGTSSGNNITSSAEGKVLKHGGALKGDETGNNPPTNNTDTLQ